MRAYRTPYTSVLKFVSPVGRVSGAATHAVGIDAGYGLLCRCRLSHAKNACVRTAHTLHLGFKFVPSAGGVVQPRTLLVEIQAMACYDCLLV